LWRTRSTQRTAHSAQRTLLTENSFAGLECLALRRVRIGGLALPHDLKLGQVRELQRAEVERVTSRGAEESAMLNRIGAARAIVRAARVGGGTEGSAKGKQPEAARAPVRTQGGGSGRGGGGGGGGVGRSGGGGAKLRKAAVR
jgi:uncharacterized membrane protein YgcG